MTTVAEENDFVSIGQVAAHVQRPVRSVERAAAELSIMPSMRVDGRPYFDARQVDLITAHLNSKGNK